MLEHHARYLWYLVAGASLSPAIRLDQEWWEEDYRRGGLTRTEGDAELPRHLLVAGLVRHYAPGGIVLDVGCGTGGLAGPLCACFAGDAVRYMGLDLSESALQIAAERGASLDPSRPRPAIIEFVTASFDDYSPRDAFDAIVFSESLYYAPDPRKTVRHYAKSLREGGILVVSMWRRPSRWRAWRALRSELHEVSRSRLIVPRRPAWDIAVFTRRSG